MRFVQIKDFCAVFKQSENIGVSGRMFFIEKSWPAKTPGPAIAPIFLPFAGCSGHCVFCAQEAQSGKRKIAKSRDIALALEECRNNLIARRQNGGLPPQVAFYGGTFTALPEGEWKMCMDFIRGAIGAGLADSFRCSTRPDRLEPARLAELSASGCALLELGLQSFSDYALEKCRRGHDGRQCAQACLDAAKAGLAVCAHLMPGLPGGSREDFLADVALALDLGVKYMRFSPCLVLAGSPLEKMWKAGGHRPWKMEETLEALAEGLLTAIERGGSVIRLGLCPQEELEAATLAGPAHPSLGSRAMGRAILLAVKNMRLELEAMHGLDFSREDDQKPALKLYAPLFSKGCLMGWRGELKGAWASLGLGPKSLRFHEAPFLRLEADIC